MLAAASQSSRIISRLTARKRVNYAGIDVAVDRCRVATFSSQRNRSGCESDRAAITWSADWEFEIPLDPTIAPPPNWIDRLVDQLAERLPRCVDGDHNPCAISLPLPWVHYQISAPSDLDFTRQQCNEMFESSLLKSPAYLRHWQAGSESDALVVAATAEQAAKRVAQVVSDIGYEVKSLLPHGVALIHAANALTSLQPSAVVLLDSTGSMVSVTEHSSCGLTRVLPPCPIASDRPLSVIELEPWLQEIANEVEASFQYASRLGTRVPAEAPVLLCGRLADTPGVDHALAGFLTRPTAIWRYAGQQRPQTSVLGSNTSPIAEAASAVALSLAYSAAEIGDAFADRGRHP